MHTSTEDTIAARPRRAVRAARALAFVLTAIAGIALFQGVAAADAQDDQMVSLINQARAQQGKPALATDPALAGVAQTWAANMGSRNQLYHNPDLAGAIDRSVTTEWTRIGENVGVGADVAGLHNAFMASPGHYANIMGDFNRVGVGHVFAGGRLWITINFLKGPALATAASPPSFQPFSDASRLVAQQYTDFLGRAVDPAGSSYWVYLLNARSTTPTAMIQSMLGSAEFSSTTAPVARLYFAYFNRLPDYAGLLYWQGRLRSGGSVFDVSSSFVQSPEFTAKYGSLSNSDFVQRVYQNVLGRTADSAGLTYWVAKLGSGLNRGQVMVNFSESPEYRAKKQAEVNVVMVYVGMLRRVPDSSGYSFWVGKVRSGASIQELIGSFFGSLEYAARVK